MKLELPLLALAVAAMLTQEPSVNAEPTSTPTPTASDVMLLDATPGATLPPICQCLYNDTLQQQELVCKSREEFSLEEDADLKDLVRWSCQFAKIDISNLDINNVAADAFSSRPDLTIVYLYSDYIQLIDAEAFRGLTSLTEVDLSDNSLLSVDSRLFVANPQLKVVSLSGNPLVELKPNAPILESESIISLDISFCKLTGLTEESFAKLPNLQRLDLSNNDIKHLPMTAVQPMPALNAFNIGNNRWNCDCALKEVVEFAKKMEATDTRVRCYGPTGPMEYWSEKAAAKYCPEPDVVYEITITEREKIPGDSSGPRKEHIIGTVLGVVVCFVVFVVCVALLVRRTTAPQRKGRVYRTSLSSTLLIPELKTSIVRQPECSRASVASGDNVNGHHYEQIR